MITPDEIKQLRGILKLTQKDLAEKLGTSIKTIANYEGGGVIPAAKQKLLQEMLHGARNVIAHNSGSVNTGNVGGHNVNIADPAVKKIIERDRVTVERDVSTEGLLQINEGLRARIADLERVIEAKDDLIKVLQHNCVK